MHCILLVNLFEYVPKDILSIDHRPDTMLSEGNYEFNIWTIFIEKAIVYLDIFNDLLLQEFFKL